MGTVLLRLPAAAAGAGSLSWSEALFTSTSATTVTGLTVVNTASDLSLFGQLVVLGLMQVGGVGFIALSVLLFRLIGRRVTLQERFFVQRQVGSPQLVGVVRLALYVLGVTLVIEAVGAAFLFARWWPTMPAGRAAYLSIFHAVSAYCNAGFDLYTGTAGGPLFGYGDDAYTLAVLTVLIVLGGLGIVVVYDLWTYRADRRLALHTRLTLVMTVLLTVLGFAFLVMDAGMQPVGDGSAGRAGTALFTVVSSRTAGLTLFPLSALAPASQLVLLLWMFVGAAPASMAGGVSTSTVAVVLAAVYTHSRGDQDVVVFGRTLPTETLYKAIAVMTVSILVVIGCTFLLVEARVGPIYPVAFEAVSAFSNTGFSLGATESLGVGGRLLVAVTMFWGRLGPLSFVVALAQRSHPSRVRYPEEAVILG